MYNFQILVIILNASLMQKIVHNLEKIILQKKMFCILTYKVFFWSPDLEVLSTSIY